ncbi:MAG: 30S ribosomal protein S21 [bacterium]|nr:30S ribosomal protein S21 [bacterium]
MQVKRRENESSSSLMYRFTKKVQHSGILREARKRRFYNPPENRAKRKLGAVYREGKRIEFLAARKLGIASSKPKFKK